MRDESYSIQQLATEARVSVNTVRKYIQMGLVSRPGGYRCAPIYTNTHLRELMHVRRSMEGNVRLGDIRDIPIHSETIVKFHS
jgi:DNA-binding transcriptional MerR regulator